MNCNTVARVVKKAVLAEISEQRAELEVELEATQATDHRIVAVMRRPLKKATPLHEQALLFPMVELTEEEEELEEALKRSAAEPAPAVAVAMVAADVVGPRVSHHHVLGLGPRDPPWTLHSLAHSKISCEMNRVNTEIRLLYFVKGAFTVSSPHH